MIKESLSFWGRVERAYPFGEEFKELILLGKSSKAYPFGEESVRIGQA